MAKANKKSEREPARLETRDEGAGGGAETKPATVEPMATAPEEARTASAKRRRASSKEAAAGPAPSARRAKRRRRARSKEAAAGAAPAAPRAKKRAPARRASRKVTGRKAPRRSSRAVAERLRRPAARRKTKSAAARPAPAVRRARKRAASAPPARKRAASAKKSAARTPAEARPSPEQLVGLPDDTLRAKTARSWAGWIEILDRAGASEWAHTAIARWLYNEHPVDAWWAQTIAKGYEQARGRRAKSERPGGIEAEASRTFAVSAAKLFDAFRDRRARVRWLRGAPEVSEQSSVKGKAIRFSWGSHEWFEARFYPKGPGRTAVVIQHGPLSSTGEALHMKTYWGEQLERLGGVVEGS